MLEQTSLVRVSWGEPVMATTDGERPTELAKILITVKTYPTPSERHVETVCVAGVRLGQETPSWVRLCPIPFRVLGFDYQFRKYQVVDVPMAHRGTRDPRPESFSPDMLHAVLGQVIDTKSNWKQRRELMGDLIGQRTACELLKLNREGKMNEAIPSLGLVKPRDVRMTVLAGEPWTGKQKLKAARAAAPTLFDEAMIRNELEPAPYEIRVKYKCLDDACRGHDQKIIDWEVGSAAYNWRRSYPETEIPVRLLEKWEGMAADDRDLHFFLGNQHQHRQSFSILGCWSPKKP